MAKKKNNEETTPSFNKELSDGLRFWKLEVQNFKGIKSKIINIEGRSMLVIGKNGKNKSSLLDALMAPLNNKTIPSKPIHDGEERGMVSVTLRGMVSGEPQSYVLDVYFTPGNQTGRLEVTNALGEKIKAPASFVKNLIGDISFDIFEFLNDSKSNKIKTLKQLTGKADEINMIETNISIKKEDYKFLKKTIETDETLIQNHGFTQDEVDLYSEPMDLSPIQERLAGVSKAIDTFNFVENGVKDKEKKITELTENNTKADTDIADKLKKIDALNEEIAELKESKQQNKLDIDTLANDIVKGKAWLEGKEKPSAEAISQEITSASLHNENNKKITEFADKQRALIQKKKDLEKAESEVKALEKDRHTVIVGSQLPVEGLTFTEDEIYLNGLPMEAEQINTAKLMDVGMEIAMSLNPHLKNIFIKNGSLLDSETRALMIKKAEEKNYRLIIEVVADNEEVEIKFTEEEL